jgi:type I restriction enzyme R subunit
MITDINSEDRLVQKTFAEHLEKMLGWENVYAYNNETFGPHGTLGRSSGMWYWCGIYVRR